MPVGYPDGMSDPRTTVTRLMERAGRTFSDEAGLTLHDKPSPLWELTVLAITLAKPVQSDLAVAAAAELRKAGCSTPQGALDLTWQQRVDALVRAHYRRFDESTATRTAEAAQFVLDRYSGDLRKTAEGAGGDTGRASEPATKLDTLVDPDDYARFSAALVRVTLDDDLATDSRG